MTLVHPHIPAMQTVQTHTLTSCRCGRGHSVARLRSARCVGRRCCHSCHIRKPGERRRRWRWWSRRCCPAGRTGEPQHQPPCNNITTQQEEPGRPIMSQNFSEPPERQRTQLRMRSRKNQKKNPKNLRNTGWLPNQLSVWVLLCSSNLCFYIFFLFCYTLRLHLTNPMVCLSRRELLIHILSSFDLQLGDWSDQSGSTSCLHLNIKQFFQVTVMRPEKINQTFRMTCEGFSQLSR